MPQNYYVNSPCHFPQKEAETLRAAELRKSEILQNNFCRLIFKRKFFLKIFIHLQPLKASNSSHGFLGLLRCDDGIPRSHGKS